MTEVLKEKLRYGFDEGWNKGNLDAMFALCASGFVHYRPPFPAIESLKVEKEDIENIFKAFSNIQFTIHEIAIEGDTAVIRWTGHAQYIGQSPDLPVTANGKEVNMGGCSVIHLVDGKIVEEWEYADYL